MVSIWFLFAVGEFWVVKRRPALAAMSSNRMVPELPDVCAATFDLNETGVRVIVATRLTANIALTKRMVSESTRWFVGRDVPRIGRFKMIPTSDGYTGLVLLS